MFQTTNYRKQAYFPRIYSGNLGKRIFTKEKKKAAAATIANPIINKIIML
jgi:hypothetical protein